MTGLPKCMINHRTWHIIEDPTVEKKWKIEFVKCDINLTPLPPGIPERATVHIDRKFQNYNRQHQHNSVIAWERRFQLFFVLFWMFDNHMFLSRQNSKSLVWSKKDAKPGLLRSSLAPYILLTGVQTDALKRVGSASCKLQRSVQASLLLTSPPV